jgi:hypothetical protein
VATERPKRDALAAIGTNRARVATADAALERAVATAIHWGATWAEIADGLGVTRQSAHERYRQLRYDPATGAAWHEPPSRSDIPAPPSPFTYHDPTVHPSLDLADLGEQIDDRGLVVRPEPPDRVVLGDHIDTDHLERQIGPARLGDLP